MNIEIQPYFAEGERYPALIGVRVEGDEYQMAYVSKVELADALAENAKLRKLVDGFTWCCGHHCGQECPLYDVSEPDYCRETSIKRELGIKV